jgi:predicted acylesterase/phospholipase RssA
MEHISARADLPIRDPMANNLKVFRAILAVFAFSSIPLIAQPALLSAQTPAVGIVFAGGGSFGAFEVGALQAFFEQWQTQHGSPPPVRVIAGTSTGALIAPFTALGQDGIREVASLYHSARRKDIFSLRAAVFLPFALFSHWSSSIYSSDPLARLLTERLSGERLTKLAAMWPETRVVVLATDFGTGQPAAYTNDPADMGPNSARYRAGTLASASPPLSAPPVFIPNGEDKPQPHFDGAVSAVAPFEAFFDLAAKSPEVALTHIVIISPYAPYPGTDTGQAQQKIFPTHPNFAELGARTGTLLSESSISKEIALVWAAISLRNAGVSQEIVKQRTGLNIAQPAVDVMLIAPETRLGWDTLRFDHTEIEEMFKRGLQAKPRHLLP